MVKVVVDKNKKKPIDESLIEGMCMEVYNFFMNDEETNKTRNSVLYDLIKILVLETLKLIKK